MTFHQLRKEIIKQTGATATRYTDDEVKRFLRISRFGMLREIARLKRYFAYLNN